MTYTVSQIAEVIAVSQNTIRNWERDLAPYLQVSRDLSGARLYDEHAALQFKRVAKLRDMGLNMSQIRDILQVMSQEQATTLSSIMTCEEIAAAGEEQPLHASMQAALDQMQANLKAFIEQNLRSIDVVQQEILADLQRLNGRTVKRRWLSR